jgi:AcrR family transcriptional regulator
MGLREEKKRRQRQAIVDAAADLFRERGYDETRVQDIVDRVAISEATFFNYFPAKDALLHELAATSVALYTAMVDYELTQDEQPVPARVHELMRALALAAVHDPELQTLLYTRSDLFRASGALKDSEMHLYDRLAELFRIGQRRREIAGRLDPLQLAEILTGIQHLVITNWLTNWWGTRDDLPARLGKAIQTFLDGCHPPTTKQRQQTHARVARGRHGAKPTHG